MTQVHGLSARPVCRLPALVATVATLLLGTVPAHAQDAVKDAPSTPVVLTQPGPLDLVKASVTRALAITQSQADAAQQRVEIHQVGEALFDFNEMSRRALGQHWTDRSPQEQEEFVRLFTDLLERSYLTAMGNRRAGTVTFQGESIEGSLARVRSRFVTERGAETSIEYRLLQSLGRWAVYDVMVEGVSFISSYRSQFNSIIRSSSFAGLLEKLREREKRLSQGGAERP
jgi:phospholipid transport system substrate-binding protein